VRRAKLYYLRGRIGKAARVAERRWGIDDDIVGKKAPAAVAESTAVDAEGVSQEEVVPTESEAAAVEATESEAAAVEATETEEATKTDQGPVDETPNEAQANTEETAESTEPKDEEPAEAGDSDEDSAG
jgi:large subunit ribosomal protein L19